jgi:hypothetical protein
MTNPMSPEQKSRLKVNDIFADCLLKKDKRLQDAILLEHMVKTLKSVGEFIEVHAGGEGRVPAFLESETGKLVLVVPGNRDARQLLKTWFNLPPHLGWEAKLGMDLDGSGLPVRELYTLSHYDAHQHLLYLNEWSGTYLRIDGEGRMTRHTNGNEILFLEAPERAHQTDIEKAQRYDGPGWKLGEDSALRKVFDTVTFDAALGLDRATAHGILMGFLLAALFRERVISLPIIHLHSGLSGTKKTSLAVALGWLLFGLTFKATACPEDKKEAENVLLNSPGYVVLDESNKMHQLQDMLKAIVTGAYIRRRKYYTTAQEEEYPVRTAVVLTTNSVSITEDALTARIFQLVVGAGTEPEWKSEFQIAEEWQTAGLRDVLWSELVGRCCAAMREITQAKAKGEEHLTVSHRMSSFWVFLRMLSRQEGHEDFLLASMDTVGDIQKTQMTTQDDLAPLFDELRGSPLYKGDWLTATEFGELLRRIAPLPGLPLQLEKLVSSSARLSNRMEQTKERIRLEIKRDNCRKVRLFRLL